MKKLVLLLIMMMFFTPITFASDNYVAYLDSCKSSVKYNPTKEIKQTMKKMLDISNDKDIEALKSMYANNYINSDGFNKEVYFSLIAETWKLYPEIIYESEIVNISVNGNTATVQVREHAKAGTSEQVETKVIRGSLSSDSTSVYYLEKIGHDWLIVSDYIISETTRLSYGEAKDIGVNLIVPQQVLANTQYTATLNLTIPDKNMITIASIAQEKVTYPQINATEVFRKLPKDGILERIFTANNENYNEYTVASIGITRTNLNKQTNEIRIDVTGLGYVITRTNIISDRKVSGVNNNEKK